jgi:phosphoribosylaminoimidazolecarboxamide formyltransferase/IMP cyclohydrolase
LKRALLSVSEKRGLKELAQTLVSSGWELTASGGTAQFLERHSIPAAKIETMSGNPEAFGGRMKTLSFQTASAILFDRDKPEHLAEAEKLGISPIDLVVCNFYPFLEAVSKELPLQEVIEQIDIGGPTLVRAAAKNFKHVLVLVDPEDYPQVQKSLLSEKEITYEERLKLAAKAFSMTNRYDSMIDIYFHSHLHEEILNLSFYGGETLRYGENPHQKGSVFWSEKTEPLSLRSFLKVSGKPLSFNNYLDADSALKLLCALGGEQPVCVIVKHANPCGAAMGETIEQAFDRAWEGDSVAAFGGIVGLNRPLTTRIAEKFSAEKKFIEIFLAPEIEDKALQILSAKKKLTILLNPSLSAPCFSSEREFKQIRGGVLIQDPDVLQLTKEKLEVVSKKHPTDQELEDLLFAWKIGKECRSNSIVLAKNFQIVGTGVGQQDRVNACVLAVKKSGERAKGSCAASDGFFPFSDGPEILIQAGAAAILHPGGSVRDRETIDLCDKYKIALVTTKGVRSFKH